MGVYFSVFQMTEGTVMSLTSCVSVLTEERLLYPGNDLWSRTRDTCKAALQDEIVSIDAFLNCG